jgi:general stress protein 26
MENTDMDDHRTPQEFQDKLWKAIKHERTVMLGLDGVEGGHTRPMTAQLVGDTGPAMWFFTSNKNTLVTSLGKGSRATAAFASKGHDLFASIQGTLHDDSADRAMVDQLWNPFVAAWFTGKDDPSLALLRLNAEHAEVWLDASSLLAGVKMLLGVDPKRDYQDKVAEIDLRH